MRFRFDLHQRGQCVTLWAVCSTRASAKTKANLFFKMMENSDECQVLLLLDGDMLWRVTASGGRSII